MEFGNFSFGVVPSILNKIFRDDILTQIRPINPLLIFLVLKSSLQAHLKIIGLLHNKSAGKT